ncbi:MAG: amidohydrolase [Chromatiales bacterium]|nr:amidohydrolase [Chromatiales bacterium]
MRLTLLQADLLWQNPSANRDMFGEQIAAQAENSDLIVLPEMFTTGFTMDAAANCEEPDGESSRWLQDMADRHGTALCGSLIIRDAGVYYNRLIWVEPGQEPSSYDKRHLFRIGGEHDHYTAGKQRLIVQLGEWRICPLVCYDLRFPVWSRCDNDYDLLLYVANWPGTRRSAWLSLLPARAVENLCYVAGVNRVGTDGNNVGCSGDSLIVDYLATIIAAAGDTVAAVSATLSLDKLERYRKKFPAWKDADSFSLSDSGR